ncbi:MAG: fused MFS/spermidine synthase [Candidatus Gracilibacteria bacterium]|nr:fused MFS/spermidine synthase [Candidatus Gracilibacteria bacterium]
MSLIIYLLSFLEGFVTLSIEIIAIRKFTPIVGANSISTSIILGVILLALSYGYYIGGKNSKNKNQDEIKDKIIFNLSISSAFYLFFTFIFDIFILSKILNATENYFISILLSSFILFFIPIFLASQTIPLLSELLKGDNTGEKIGKLLFFSTIGSFLGSVVTSTVLFSSIGVEKSATLNSFILSSLAICLIFITYKKIKISYIVAIFTFLISILLLTNKEILNNNIIYKTSNSYHNLIIANIENDKRVFFQNAGYASGIDLNTGNSFFKYIIEIKNKLIENRYENIAIIGAAGFTLPNEMSQFDFIKNIDVVDIDGSLKEISEKYFLEKNLSDKINFINEPSRYFLQNTIKNNKKYDAIVIDIYHGDSLPPQTLTLEFFQNLKKISENIYINMITDNNLKSDFSKKLLNTMESSFGEIYYKDVNQYKQINSKTNFVMTNLNLEGYEKYKKENDLGIYTDDKHSIEIDLYKTR